MNEGGRVVGRRVGGGIYRVRAGGWEGGREGGKGVGSE